MRSRGEKSLDIWVMLLVMLTIVCAIIALNVFMQEPDDWRKLAFDLMNALLSAIVVGLIISTFTKVIAERLLSVKKNDRKLAGFGVREIGTGESSNKDRLDMFGNPLLGKYPKEIKLFFITGNGFINRFRADIIKAVVEGNCRIKILIASKDDNGDFLMRMEALCPQKTSYEEQIEKETLPAIDHIREELKDKKDRISVRFYKDEFRYCFRIAKFYDMDLGSRSNYWVNVQPPNLDAVEMSVVLKGEATDQSSENSLFAQVENSFDTLWDRYRDTEY